MGHSPSVVANQTVVAEMKNGMGHSSPVVEDQSVVANVKEAKIVKARDTMDVALYCWLSQRPA